ncbi:chromatin associated protein [Mycena vitilis]|nr:chromatin associated protein [Mycena vitilis]
MASGSVYQHRALGSVQDGQGVYNARGLADTLERVKQEFELLASEVGMSREQRERYEATIASQTDELEKIRQALHDLEAQHNKVRQQYEYELRVLRSEARAPPPLPPPPPHPPSSLPLSHSHLPLHPSSGPLSHSQLPPSHSQAQQQQSQQPQRPGSAIATLSSPSIFMAPPPHGHSPVMDPSLSSSARDRDSASMSSAGLGRERDSASGMGSGLGLGRERERERERDIQRARFLEQGSGVGASNKRIKLDQGESTRLPLIGPGSSPSSRRAPTPLPPIAGSALGGLPPASGAHGQHTYMNDFLTALDPSSSISNNSSNNANTLAGVHPEWKKEGSDWFVVYNPKVKRTLDVGLVHTFIHETVVCCIQFSGDGKYLATGCNRTAQIYEVQSGRKVCVLADDTSTPSKTGDLYIRSVRFSPDGRYLATGAEDERIRIWDIESRTIRVLFEGHHQDIYSLDFARDGRRLVSGSGDATVRVWDMPPSLGGAGDPYGDRDRDARYDREVGRPLVLTATPESDAPDDDAGVMAVAVSPDGGLIAAGCVDALVRVWSVPSSSSSSMKMEGVDRGGSDRGGGGGAHLVEVLRGHQNSVHSVVFTRDGSGLVSGALDNTIRVWDLSYRAKGGVGAGGGGKGGGVPCTVFVGHKDYVLSVGISRDAQWIVSGSKDRGVHFWDANGVVQCMLQGHKNSVISTSLHPVGNLLATGSGDKLARIWNYNTV